MPAQMKTKTFTGLDDVDLSRKVWEWQTTNPVIIQQTHPDEVLPMQATAPKHLAKLDKFPDRWSRRIDYCER
jgi:hypothetical protein